MYQGAIENLVRGKLNGDQTAPTRPSNDAACIEDTARAEFDGSAWAAVNQLAAPFATYIPRNVIY